jgi:hypothetical protein
LLSLIDCGMGKRAAYVEMVMSVAQDFRGN